MSDKMQCGPEYSSQKTNRNSHLSRAIYHVVQCEWQASAYYHLQNFYNPIDFL